MRDAQEIERAAKVKAQELYKSQDVNDIHRVTCLRWTFVDGFIAGIAYADSHPVRQESTNVSAKHTDGGNANTRKKYRNSSLFENISNGTGEVGFGTGKAGEVPEASTEIVKLFKSALHMLEGGVLRQGEHVRQPDGSVKYEFIKTVQGELVEKMRAALSHLQTDCESTKPEKTLTTCDWKTTPPNDEDES